MITMEIEAGSVLANRGLNYGYGYQGFNQGNFAGDGSAVKESVRGSRDISLLESVNNGTRDQFLANQIRQHDSNISDRIGMGQDFLSTQIRDQGVEFRFASIERQMTANQAALVAQLHAADIKATECCCELKAGQATIIANQESARLAAAESENQNLRLQIAINNQGSQGNG